MLKIYNLILEKLVVQENYNVLANFRKILKNILNL